MKTRTLLAFVLLTVYPGISQAKLERAPDPNPWVGTHGTHGAGTMHGDTASSDTTPLPGPGAGSVHSSTYGYPYPAVTEGAGPAVPESAKFVGGMARIDVRDDLSGCDLIWQNNVRSSAVPKLSLNGELIYTIERDGSADNYHFTAVDPYSGGVARRTSVGWTPLHNTLQMAGNIGTHGVYWQGTMGGILRVSP